jgi:hypothetical protein
MTATFSSDGDDLYLEEHGHKHKVERGYESMTGWYWFLIERAEDVYETEKGEEYGFYYQEGQGKRRGNKPRPPKHKTDRLIDTKWFCYTQGFEDEWGYVCESQLRHPLIWEIKKIDLPHSGRRGR